MKILLDECVPRKLKQIFRDHDCQTVGDAGLAGTSNGKLLALAERELFDIFITLDQGIEYQQNLDNRKIAILVIALGTNRSKDLLKHKQRILDGLVSTRAGTLLRLTR